MDQSPYNTNLCRICTRVKAKHTRINTQQKCTNDKDITYILKILRCITLLNKIIIQYIELSYADPSLLMGSEISRLKITLNPQSEDLLMGSAISSILPTFSY